MGAGQFGKKRSGGGGGAVTSVFGRVGAVTALAADYSAFYLGVPISKTVAQMQALVGSFAEGQQYLITNAAAGQGTCELLVTAIDASTLTPVGIGGFQNAAMAAPVLVIAWYDLTTDFIYQITRPADIANTSLPVTVTDKGNGAIALFPFDDTVNYQNCNLDNPILSLTGACSMFNVTLGDGCTVDLNVSGLADVFAGSQNGFTLAASASISQAFVGTSNTFTLPDGHIIQKAQIGDSKGIDATGFATGTTWQNVVYIGDKSTFWSDATMNSNVNETAGIIDLTSLQFVGILYPGNNDTSSVNQITLVPTDHSIEFRGKELSAPLTFADAVNNVFNGGSVDIILGTASEDWVSYRSGSVTTTDAIQIDSQIY